MCVCVMYALTTATAETLMRTLSSYYEGHLGHSFRTGTTPSKPIVVDDVVFPSYAHKTHALCTFVVQRTAHCAAQRSFCGWHAASSRIVWRSLLGFFHVYSDVL